MAITAIEAQRSIRRCMMHEALGRLRWKALLESSHADECDSVLDLANELNEVGSTMKLVSLLNRTVPQ